MKRVILGVLAGLIFNFILSTGVDFLLHFAGYFPAYGQPMFDYDKVLVALTYRSVFIVLCSYVTAVIAKDKAKKAVVTIGIIGSLLWLAGAIALWNLTPAYYNVAGVFIGLPLALAGYHIYIRKIRKDLMNKQVPVINTNIA